MKFEDYWNSLATSSTDTAELLRANEFAARHAWEAATKAEREACAKVCEELAEAFRNAHDTAANHAGDDCAAAIRARKTHS